MTPVKTPWKPIEIAPPLGILDAANYPPVVLRLRRPR